MTNHLARYVLAGIVGGAAVLVLRAVPSYAEFGDAVVPNEPYSRTFFPGMKEGLWPGGTNWPGYKDEVAGKPPKTAKEVVLYWPKDSRKLAQAVIEKYGKPDKISRASLVWENKGPFLKTVVFRDADWIDAERTTKGDLLQQTVSYHAKPESVAAVADFDTRVVIDCEHATMTSTADSEEANVLALNLADEVAIGQKTPEQAIALRDKVDELSAAGKQSPLTKGLMFQLQP